MNKRSKLWAILGASVLTLGVVGMALAEELKEPHRNLSVDANGNVSGGDSANIDRSCDLLNVGVGQVGFLFVLSPTAANSGNIWVDFTGQPDQGPVAQIAASGSTLKWAIVTGTPVTLVDATTDVDGTDAEKDELKISHICVGETSSSSSSESSTTTETFTSSEESSTTSSEESSTTSSEESSTTSSETFSSSQESTTITQPPTDTIGNSGSGNQATGIWLLVAALGVLLGSLVVVAPARVKNRR